MQIEWCASTRALQPRALAAVRQGAREGTLLDVATDQIFIGLFLRNLSQNLWSRRTIYGLSSSRPACSRNHIKEPERIRTIEQSNSTALVDNQYVAKIYRQLESGINPRSSLGHYSPRSPALLMRRHCSAASNWRKAIAAARSASCMPMSRTRVMAGP